MSDAGEIQKIKITPEQWEAVCRFVEQRRGAPKIEEMRLPERRTTLGMGNRMKIAIGILVGLAIAFAVCGYLISRIGPTF